MFKKIKIQHIAIATVFIFFSGVIRADNSVNGLTTTSSSASTAVQNSFSTPPLSQVTAQNAIASPPPLPPVQNVSAAQPSPAQLALQSAMPDPNSANNTVASSNSANNASNPSSPGTQDNSGAQDNTQPGQQGGSNVTTTQNLGNTPSQISVDQQISDNTISLQQSGQQFLSQPPIPAPAPSPVISSKSLTYRQSQQMMLNTAPEDPIHQPAEANDAFNALLQQNMPLSPQQVVRLRQLIDASQRAAAIPANVPPKPVSTTLMINLAPGTTPPAIRLAQGYVTSLVFVDSTGAPWPIAAYDIGDPKTSNIQWDGKGNVMLIQASSPYSVSDLVIRLVGLMTPITLELVSGQRVVDYRTDIHVSGLGPNAKDLPLGTALPNSANQILLDVLDGVAPAGSKLLSVKGGDCQAWLAGDTMYLRTRLTILSPGWVGRMISPDGMYAYEIQKTSSVLVSQYGEPIELKIEGF